MPGSVIVSGKRTPIGKLSGAFAGMTAGELGTVAIKGALDAAGISGEQVEYVIMGQVIQAGAGQNPARKAGTDAGIPMSTPSFTLNKVCLSGLDAIAIADQMIQAGEYDIVVAGGMESMTEAPYLLPKARARLQVRRRQDPRRHRVRRPHRRLRPRVDGRLHRALRERDRPHPRGDGRVLGRVAPARRRRRRRTAASTPRSPRCPVPQRKGDPIVVTEDEGVRGDTTAEGLGKLKPGVRQGRRHHRGTRRRRSPTAPRRAVVMSAKKAEELGLEVARRRSATTAGSPARTTRCSRSRRGPSYKALQREGIEA